jgi:HAMP domain-containing protein
VVRRIPIRAKVAGALALPLLGIVVAGVLGVSAAASVGHEIHRQTALTAASLGHSGLIEALQAERNLALLRMLGLTGEVELGVDDDAARDATNAASAALRRSIAGEQDALRTDYAEALESLSFLRELRERVDAAAADPGPAHRQEAHDVFIAYSGMLATLFGSHDRFALVVDDPELRQGDDLVHYGAHAADAAAQVAERLVYLGTSPGGVDTASEVVQVAELRRDQVRANGAIETRARGAYESAYDVLVEDPRVLALPELALEVSSSPGRIDPGAVLAATPLGPDSGYLDLRDEVVDVLDERAGELATEADSRRRRYAAAALGLVAAALLVAWWVSRSITRPLRELSVDARALATYRLPAAVEDILATPAGHDLEVPEVGPVRTKARDEVGDVATALEDVQQSALGLAVEQAALRRNVAESFVNLGRRNQNLLGRLIDVVRDLEHDEAEPARLAELRRLAHLATRIRRNADSLLVLSGAEAPASWQPPQHVSEVVRSALGEVENYERVVVRSLDPVMVLGAGAGDLAHLLAELIENGLRHSPPRELVEVAGEVTADGYRITIVDHGLGMTPDEIDRANLRLAGAESVAVTPARYLGHYVTAVLAARHDVGVRLRGSVVVGIAAVVDLPASLVTDDAPALPALGAPSAAPSGSDRAPSLPLAPGGRPDVEVVEPELVVRPRRARTTIAVTANGASGAHGVTTTFPAGTGPGAPRVVGPAPAPPPTAPDLAGAGAAPGPVPGRGPGPGAGPRPHLPDAAELPPEASAGRTASGLVRRVRGASVPAGASATRGGELLSAAAVPPDEASSHPVDSEGILRFLTNLTAGVQRSLDEQAMAEGDRE